MEKTKPFIFTGNMTVYVDNPKKSTEKLPEQDTRPIYKKSIVFLFSSKKNIGSMILKKERSWSIHTINFKIYYKTMVIKTMWNGERPDM